MGWEAVGRIEEIPAGVGQRVQVGRQEIALFRDGETVRAIDDRCPHRGAPLSEGFLEQGKVYCPWHCFDFCLTTGASTAASHLRVSVYPVEIREGVLYLEVDSIAGSASGTAGRENEDDV